MTRTDAKFVDVIHTDGGVFGFPTAIGHADFFPNGGVALQPGCRLSQLSRRGHPEEVGKFSRKRIYEIFLPIFDCYKIIFLNSCLQS